MADVFIGTQALETGLPFVTNEFPAPGAVDVPVDTNISFTVLDDVGGAGIDVNSIDVDIEGTPAIVDGVFQPGYTGSIVANGNGFDVTINPDVDLPGSTLIGVDVFAADLAEPPNTVNASWSFTTEFVAAGGGATRWQWRYIFNIHRRRRSW
jgi:hypothetical protein